MDQNPIPPDVYGHADPSDLLDITVRHSSDTVTLAARGEVDLYTAPMLTAALREAIAADTRLVVVDLAEVTFMASSGLTVLLDALNQARARQCQLRLAGGGRPVQVLLAASGADSEFEHYPTAADAVRQPFGVSQ